MEIEFENRKLLDLYEKGTSKKYCLDKGVLKKFSMRIQQLEAAKDIYDLWKTPSIKFEKMKSAKCLYSLRIDRTYRLEIKIRFTNEEKTIGKVYIRELSKHYGE